MMRLTLRTMLAYLDDVLEPADAEELGKKIRESDFAAGLVERIRGVTKKLRMDAPKLDGKGMGNDANTVAEYLDSELPQDRVGDFERICLESDKHLCEVAACHQVLALVLGKAADVPEGLRDRVYALGNPEAAEQAAGGKAGAAHDAKVVAPPPPPSNGRPAEAAAPLEVPEYLRAGRERSQWSLVSAVALLLLLGVIVAALIGPSKFSGLLAKRDSGEPAVPPEPAPAAPADSAPTAPPTALPNTPPDSSDSVLPSSPPPVPGPAPGAPPADSVPSPGDAVAPSPAAPMPPVAAPTPPTAEPTPTLPAIAATPAAPAPASPQQPREPSEIGRFESDGQLVATLNPVDGSWYPKQAKDLLVPGERLIVLPSYRPQFSLSSAALLTFAGEGALVVQRPAPSGIPHVSIEYGRMLATTSRAGAEVLLDLGEIRGVLTLVDASSAAAISVSRWSPPGIDPAELPGMPIVEIYSTGGKIAWQPINGARAEKMDIGPQMLLLYMDQDPPQTIGPFEAPLWIDGRNEQHTDRVRSEALVRERLIKPGRSLNVSFQELATGRRVEFRSLAARCLAALGEFEPLIREFNDARQSSYWTIGFQALCRNMTRSTDNAAKVREQLKLQRPAEAKNLYRLLCGYSQEELNGREGEQLIKFLESDQLDIRVLAHMNIVAITGAWENYYPEKPPALQQAAIRALKARRDKEGLHYRVPPAPSP